MFCPSDFEWNKLFTAQTLNLPNKDAASKKYFHEYRWLWVLVVKKVSVGIRLVGSFLSTYTRSVHLMIVWTCIYIYLNVIFACATRIAMKPISINCKKNSILLSMLCQSNIFQWMVPWPDSLILIWSMVYTICGLFPALEN